MAKNFRKSMDGLHTWVGVVLGSLLFAIFWMGSLSVVDREIDEWMRPELRLPAVENRPSIDDLVLPQLEEVLVGSSSVSIDFPTKRLRAFTLGFAPDGGEYTRVYLDPATGDPLKVTDSLAGTEFLYPFHYNLHLNWANIGEWIVGSAAIGLLVLIVSGVSIHRKILKDFFTFRHKSSLRRSTLDLHNLTGVIGIPFYVLMSLTGLYLFFFIYLQWSVTLPFEGDISALYEEIFGYEVVAPQGITAPIASIDRMVSEAEVLWAAGIAEGNVLPRADRVFISNYGDANAIVHVRRVFPETSVSVDSDVVLFIGTTGEIKNTHTAQPVRQIHAWLSGFHLIQFDSWVLRWLYLANGLLGCTMIATGQLFWMRARMKFHAPDPIKVRVVRSLTIGSTTGIILATIGFFVVNRLLSQEAVLFGIERAALEVASFFTVWIIAFAHAAFRGSRAWSDQLLAIMALSLLATLLNWVTTGDHLVVGINKDLWAIVGLDLSLLAVALASALCGFRLRAQYS